MGIDKGERTARRNTSGARVSHGVRADVTFRKSPVADISHPLLFRPHVIPRTPAIISFEVLSVYYIVSAIAHPITGTTSLRCLQDLLIIQTKPRLAEKVRRTARRNGSPFAAIQRRGGNRTFRPKRSIVSYPCAHASPAYNSLPSGDAMYSVLSLGSR